MSQEDNMITAIYICEPTTLNIATNESDLELCGMGAAAPVPLHPGELQVERGIYKIVSTTDVAVTGTPAPLLVQRYNPKTGSGPEQFLSEVAEQFAGITLLQMQDFFAVADLRDYPNP